MRETLKSLRKKLRAPSYAEVVATLALFIALGGVSYAAIKIPKNSVGTKELRKNSVGTRELKKNAVTGNKVRNRSLQAADFKTAAVPGSGTGLITGHSRLGNQTEFFAVSGVSVATNDQYKVTTLSPAVSITADNLAISLSQAPGPGSSREIQLLAEGAQVVLSCSFGRNQTNCARPRESDEIVLARDLVMKSVVDGTPSPTDIDFGFTTSFWTGGP